MKMDDNSKVVTISRAPHEEEANPDEEESADTASSFDEEEDV